MLILFAVKRYPVEGSKIKPFELITNSFNLSLLIINLLISKTTIKKPPSF